MEQVFTFKTDLARRLPDPNFKTQYGLEKHIFLVRARNMPPNISNKPNARDPNVDRSIYKDVRKSLLNEEGEENTFHLKNKGITIIAESVKDRGNGVYDVTMESSRDGILDGGHTYAIIRENEVDIPENQFVQVEIRVGVPTGWIPELSGGLNTAIQVQSMSLRELEGKFQWIKDALGDKKKHIAWRENESGKNLDARDVICLLTLFNVQLYPNSAMQHPVAAYTGKERPLEQFRANQTKYECMKPIILDILVLYDTIGHQARDVWNQRNKNAKGASLSFIDSRARGRYSFPFIEKEGEHRLNKPALYPILGGFRNFVELDETMGLEIKWKYPFPKIIEFWKKYGGELLEITNETNQDVKQNQNAVGKNSGYWRTAHAVIGRRILEHFG